MNGITWMNQHSETDFDATITERILPPPPKDRITERVPYSSVTYDFTALYGSATYGERTLQYKFMLSDYRGMTFLKNRVSQFIQWLYSSIEKSPLYDDTEEGYYYNAVCTDVSAPSYTGGTVAELTVTFMADPFKVRTVL